MKRTSEDPRFTEALKKVLSVSHDELKARIEADKEERKRRIKRASVAPSSAVGH